MKKSCKYCGKIHPVGKECDKKPKKNGKRDTREDRFRHTQKWIKKSREIRERDGYVCRMCESGRDGVLGRLYNNPKLSVHHIRKLSQCWAKRLDNSNLITLCEVHHRRADAGEYSVEELEELAKYPPGRGATE